MKKTMCTEIDLDTVTKEELLALCQMLAKNVMDGQDAVTNLFGVSAKERGDRIIMEYPIVQGTSNQIALRQFGERPTDNILVQSAFWKLVRGKRKASKK